MDDDYKPGELSLLVGSTKSLSEAIVSDIPIPVLDAKHTQNRKRKLDQIDNDTDSTQPKSKKIRHNTMSPQNATNEGSDETKDNTTVVTPIYEPKIRLNIERKTKIAKRESFKRSQKEMLKTLPKSLQRQSGTAKGKKTVSQLLEIEKERKEMAKRTLFLGNIPDYWKKKHVSNFLQQWTEYIENVNFSNFVKSHKFRKMKKKYQKKVDNGFVDDDVQITDKSKKNMNCWVRMTDRKYVSEALILNNTIVEKLWTVRVDYADSTQNRDNDQCVFVGGLGLDATEDEIRTHFKECGDIVNVRLLRHPKTLVSRGCGFIQFVTLNGVSAALDMHNSRFGGTRRRIRVVPHVDDATKVKSGGKDSEKQHLKSVLSAHPNKLRNTKGKIIMAIDRTATDAAVPRDGSRTIVHHKGRDKYQNKLRWRDNPQMREKAEERRKKDTIETYDSDDADNYDNDGNFVQLSKKQKRKKKKAKKEKSGNNDYRDGKEFLKELEKKKRVILYEQEKKIKKMKHRRWLANKRENYSGAPWPGKNKRNQNDDNDGGFDGGFDE